MRDTWPAFYRRVLRVVDEWNVNIVYFRGHSTATWRLLPGLARKFKEKKRDTASKRRLEVNFYSDFVTSAGDLIARTADSWDKLFLMQHHGLPTRLLDWSESFGIALYFAVSNEHDRPAIWLLNPYALNRRTMNVNGLFDVDDLAAGYEKYFLEESISFPGEVMAIRPRRHVRRVANQLSGFTLHRDLSKPLERLYPEAVKKFPIPRSAIAGARQFLALAGISEYTLFPDLDGLARHLKRFYRSA